MQVLSGLLSSVHQQSLKEIHLNFPFGQDSECDNWTLLSKAYFWGIILMVIFCIAHWNNTASSPPKSKSIGIVIGPVLTDKVIGLSGRMTSITVHNRAMSACLAKAVQQLSAHNPF